ncbi:MAG: DedA family protein [Planctomycetes bacterium]|nr:DedA family protein [Planctomycetota bacterium]
MEGWLLETLTSYPYLSVALVFIACGLGAPLPEEIVLLSAGYVTYRGAADPATMMVVAGTSILAGDLIPFSLGRSVGPNLMRIRAMRFLITPERLARFDRWFRRRGDFVVLLSRFIAGMRVVSFFIAGTMRMSWPRFLALDGGGIALIVPPLVWLGSRYGGTIEAVVAKAQSVERGILVAALSAAAVGGLWYWLRWRRRQRLLVGGPAETFVEPTSPKQMASAASAMVAAAVGLGTGVVTPSAGAAPAGDGGPATPAPPPGPAAPERGGAGPPAPPAVAGPTPDALGDGPLQDRDQDDRNGNTD